MIIPKRPKRIFSILIFAAFLAVLTGLGLWRWLNSPPTELDLKLYFGTPPEPPPLWQLTLPNGDASYNERQLAKTDLNYTAVRFADGKLYICIRDQTRLALPKYAEAVQYYPHAAVFCLPMEEEDLLALKTRVETVLGDLFFQPIKIQAVPMLYVELGYGTMDEALRLLKADGTIDLDRLVLRDNVIHEPD